MIDLLFDQVPFLGRGVASGIDQDLGLISTLVEDCKFSCWWWRGAFDPRDADAVSTPLDDDFREVLRSEAYRSFPTSSTAMLPM